MHVIVALEPRAFREVVSEALRLLRPDVAVHPVEGGGVEDVLDMVAVDLVIASRAARRSVDLPWLVLGDPAGAALVAGNQTASLPLFDFASLLSIVDGMAMGGHTA